MTLLRTENRLPILVLIRFRGLVQSPKPKVQGLKSKSKSKIKNLNSKISVEVPVFTRYISASLRATLLLTVALFISTTANAQTKLLRFPDIHGDKVVFTYGGDLWTAPAAGGTAVRLTAHPGIEVFAKFSPD